MSTVNAIWVTGASGYSGPFLIAEIKKRYPETRIIAISRTAPASCADVDLPLDLLDAKSLDQALKTYSPTVIFHLAAAMPPQSDADLWHYNTAMIFELLQALDRNNLNQAKVVSVGSAAELQHKAGGAYHEEDPSLGVTPYGKSKAAQFRLAKQLSKELGIPVYFPRAFNMLGPGLPEKWVAGRLCRQLVTSTEKLRLGSLSAERDFLDIRDVVAAYCEIVEKGEPGRLYHVCSGASVAIQTLVDKAIGLLKGGAPEIEVDEVQTARSEVSIVYGDPKRIQEEIGWKPVISLERAILDMLEYFNNAPA